jgi:dynein heavy chain
LEGAENKKSLTDIENQILDVLANATNILEDEKGIEVLQASKSKSNEIAEK